MIYPEDSAIQRLNNQGQEYNLCSVSVPLGNKTDQKLSFSFLI